MMIYKFLHLLVFACIFLHSKSTCSLVPKKYLDKLSLEECYNTNTFSIAPNSSFIPLTQTSVIFSSIHSNYVVNNIGRTVITGTLKWGTIIKWKGDLVIMIVKPGMSVVFDNLGRSYYVTGIEVKNEDLHTRAIVQIYDEDGSKWKCWQKNNFKLEIDINNVMRGLTLAAVDHIPIVGKVLTRLIGFFWPATPKDIWMEISEKVEKFVNPQLTGVVDVIFSSRIRVFKRRIYTIHDEIRAGTDKSRLAKQVMNLVEEMIGIEEEFILKKADALETKRLNYETLPLYSAFINLKMLFYQYTILNRDRLGINEEDVKEIGMLSKATVYNVEKYLMNMIYERIEYTYNVCNVENIYNAIQTVRTYINFMGISYLSFWKQLASHPENEKKPINDVLLYPSFFGRPTIPLLKLVTMNPHEQPLPLTPDLVDGKRSRLIEIVVYTTDIGGRPVLSGIITEFSGGSKFYLGRIGNKMSVVDLRDNYIYKLAVDGDGAVEQITIFTDKEGTKHRTFGTTQTGVFAGVVYEQQNYHIAAIFVDNDGPNKNQTWNIAVSYLSNEE